MIKRIVKFLQLHLYQKWRIPHGDYCYFRNRSQKCHYWVRRKDWPEQADGYCRYLGWGDMDKNSDSTIIMESINLKTREVTRTPAPEMPFGISLLWDQCKECGVNE